MISGVTGADLRAAREAKGVGIRVIANAAGRDRGHLSRVEKGERDPTPALINIYERVLGVQLRPAGAATSAATHLRQSSSTVQEGSLDESPRPAEADLEDAWEDDVRRRRFVSTLTAFALAAPALMRVE